MSKSKLMKYVCSIVWLVASSLAFAESVQSIPLELRALHSNINQKLDRISEAQRTFDQLQSRESALKRQDRDLVKELGDAKAKVDRLSAMDLEYPGSVDEALSQAKEEYGALYKKKRDSVSKIKRAREDLAQAKTRVQALKNELSPLRDRYSSALKSAVDLMVGSQIKSMTLTKNVVGEGRAACGQLTVSECKRQARLNAERDANEKGSVVTVEAVTEISNLKLSKEEIRSETQGQLSDIEQLESSFTEDGEVFKTKIRARVTSVVSDRAKIQLAKNIRSEIVANLGGDPSFGVLADDGGSSNTLQTASPEEIQEEERERERERREDARRIAQEREALERERAEMARLRENRIAAEAAARVADEQRRQREREAARRDTRVLPSF